MIGLVREPIDVEAVRRSVEAPGLGGVVVFCGEVRNSTGSRITDRLEYEAYEEMALSEMKRIACEAQDRFRAAVAMVHRLGVLLPGETAVVTAAACEHREQAFECCRFLIDALKSDVPIWKKEVGPNGEEWV